MTGQTKKGNKRSLARLGSVQALYQMDIAGSDLQQTLVEFESYRLGCEVDGVEYAKADVVFFRDVVSGVVREQRELDPIIDQTLAKDWPLTRIDSIMRQILRSGLYELMYRSDVPPKAAISEYVDVARAFFEEGDEPKVVNAVLDRLAKLARPDDFSVPKAVVS